MDVEDVAEVRRRRLLALGEPSPSDSSDSSMLPSSDGPSSELGSSQSNNATEPSSQVPPVKSPDTASSSALVPALPPGNVNFFYMSAEDLMTILHRSVLAPKGNSSEDVDRSRRERASPPVPSSSLIVSHGQDSHSSGPTEAATSLLSGNSLEDEDRSRRERASPPPQSSSSIFSRDQDSHRSSRWEEFRSQSTGISLEDENRSRRARASPLPPSSSLTFSHERDNHSSDLGSQSSENSSFIHHDGSKRERALPLDSSSHFNFSNRRDSLSSGFRERSRSPPLSQAWNETSWHRSFAGSSRTSPPLTRPVSPEFPSLGAVPKRSYGSTSMRPSSPPPSQGPTERPSYIGSDPQAGGWMQVAEEGSSSWVRSRFSPPAAAGGSSSRRSPSPGWPSTVDGSNIPAMSTSAYRSPSQSASQPSMSRSPDWSSSGVRGSQVTTHQSRRWDRSPSPEQFRHRRRSPSPDFSFLSQRAGGGSSRATSPQEAGQEVGSRKSERERRPPMASDFTVPARQPPRALSPEFKAPKLVPSSSPAPAKRGRGRPRKSELDKPKSAKKKKDDSDGHICVICREQISGKMSVTKCGHYFHEACLEGWMSVPGQAARLAKVCPVCGGDFFQNEVNPMFLC